MKKKKKEDDISSQQFDLYMYHQFVWQITGQPSVLYYAASILEVHEDLDPDF